MTRNVVLFVAASLAILVLWYRAVDHFAPLPAQPPVAAASVAQAGAASGSAAQAVAVAPAPAAAAEPRRAAAERTVRVDTPLATAVLSTRGARVVAFKLHGVSSMAAGTQNTELNLVPSSDSSANGDYGTLRLQGEDSGLDDWTLLTPAPRSTPDGVEVRFALSRGGLDFVKTFLFRPGQRAVGVRVDVRNAGAKAVPLDAALSWGPDLGGDGGGFGRNVRGAVVLLPDRVERHNASKDPGKTSFDGARWVALKNHYFVVALFPEQGSAWDRAELADLGNEHLSVALETPDGVAVAPGATLTLAARLWAGPQEYSLLKSQGDNFESVVQFQSWSAFSWINPLCVGLLYVLKWFHSITGNWGVAIILLTLLVRGAMFYPSMKSMVSMRHMQRKQAVLKPRLDTLKKTYKDNAQKLNEETMKLYKEFGVNPLGGCLPMLFQLPVFWALYDTLAAAYELRGAGFFWKWTDMSAGDPTYIFPVAMGVSMFLQQKLSPTAAAASDEQQQMQKTMLWMMPIMFGGMAVWMKWPVGLLLYWTASNVVGVVQQLVVNRVVKD